MHIHGKHSSHRKPRSHGIGKYELHNVSKRLSLIGQPKSCWTGETRHHMSISTIARSCFRGVRASRVPIADRVRSLLSLKNLSFKKDCRVWLHKSTLGKATRHSNPQEFRNSAGDSLIKWKKDCRRWLHKSSSKAKYSLLQKEAPMEKFTSLVGTQGTRITSSAPDLQNDQTMKDDSVNGLPLQGTKRCPQPAHLHDKENIPMESDDATCKVMKSPPVEVMDTLSPTERAPTGTITEEERLAVLALHRRAVATVKDQALMNQKTIADERDGFGPLKPLSTDDNSGMPGAKRRPVHSPGELPQKKCCSRANLNSNANVRSECDTPYPIVQMFEKQHHFGLWLEAIKSKVGEHFDCDRLFAIKTDSFTSNSSFLSDNGSDSVVSSFGVADPVMDPTVAGDLLAQGKAMGLQVDPTNAAEAAAFMQHIRQTEQMRKQHLTDSNMAFIQHSDTTSGDDNEPCHGSILDSTSDSESSSPSQTLSSTGTLQSSRNPGLVCATHTFHALPYTAVTPGDSVESLCDGTTDSQEDTIESSRFTFSKAIDIYCPGDCSCGCKIRTGLIEDGRHQGAPNSPVGSMSSGSNISCLYSESASSLLYQSDSSDVEDEVDKKPGQ